MSVGAPDGEGRLPMDAPEIWTALAALAAAYIASRGFARSRWPLHAAPADRAAEPGEPARFATAAPAQREEGALAPAERLDEGATEAEITLSEERLQVDRRRRPHERVRLRKYVVTEYVTVRVPVKREEVSLERIPIDEDDGEPADGPEVVLMTEEPVIEKHVVARERVRLHKDVMTAEREVTETVRREQAEVEQDPEPHHPTEEPR
jgi:uncharacterized protein (TIGR02271 family)